jgi:hypothetical protein
MIEIEPFKRTQGCTLFICQSVTEQVVRMCWVKFKIFFCYYFMTVHCRKKPRIGLYTVSVYDSKNNERLFLIYNSFKKLSTYENLNCSQTVITL